MRSRAAHSNRRTVAGLRPTPARGLFLTGSAVPGSVVARMAASRARTHRVSVTCRYQPVALRTSYLSRPTSCLASSKARSMHQLVPATCTTVFKSVSRGRGPGRRSSPALEVRAALDRMDMVVNAPDTRCLVLLEARARGVPVIASDVPVAHEFAAGCGNSVNFHPPRNRTVPTACLAGFLALPADRRAALRSAVAGFAQPHRSFEAVRRLCRLHADAIAVYRRNGSSQHPHWDGRLTGWVYRAPTDGLVSVLQGLRTQ